MAFIYTPREVRQALESDAKHGAMYAHVWREFDKRGFSFTVENLGTFSVSGYKTTDKALIIDTGASDIATAAKFARNGLREWAGKGISDNNNYFGETARAWAKSQSNSCTKCCGSTVDFLYLFSKETAEGVFIDKDHMYPISSNISRDLKGILLWVFVNWWELGLVMGLDSAPVETNQSDLHPDYHDSQPGHFDEDQTHHFAFYFYIGVKVGSFLPVLKPFLKKTKDVDEHGHIINEGDYYLGITAARLGDEFDDFPQFMGAKIAEALQKPSPSKAFDRVARDALSAADPWITERGKVAHPHSPSGEGGPGRFASAKPLSFEPKPGGLPHANSPAARTLDPLEIDRYSRRSRRGFG